MSRVQCENPDCGKLVEKEKAATFSDRDWFRHYACDNCLIKAMLAWTAKDKIARTYAKAIER